MNYLCNKNSLISFFTPSLNAHVITEKWVHINHLLGSLSSSSPVGMHAHPRPGCLIRPAADWTIVSHDPGTAHSLLTAHHRRSPLTPSQHIYCLLHFLGCCHSLLLDSVDNSVSWLIWLHQLQNDVINSIVNSNISLFTLYLNYSLVRFLGWIHLGFFHLYLFTQSTYIIFEHLKRKKQTCS